MLRYKKAQRVGEVLKEETFEVDDMTPEAVRILVRLIKQFELIDYAPEAESL